MVPIETVTELRNQHANGNKDFGINVRKGAVTNIKEENVLQPLLVTSYAIKQASETVRSILKIDDIVSLVKSKSVDFGVSTFHKLPRSGKRNFSEPGVPKLWKRVTVSGF